MNRWLRLAVLLAALTVVLFAALAAVKGLPWEVTAAVMAAGSFATAELIDHALKTPPRTPHRCP